MKRIYIFSNTKTKEEYFVGLYESDLIACDAFIEVAIQKQINITECSFVSFDYSAELKDGKHKINTDLVNRYNHVVQYRSLQSFKIQKYISEYLAKNTEQPKE